MRTISVAGLAKLAQTKGTEPFNVIHIKWRDDLGVYKYGDKQLPGVKGSIRSIAGLDSTITLDKSGDSISVEVTIDDTDGEIKQLFDQYDLHKRPTWIYQGFTGLDESDWFLLLRGEVNSPITWKESERSVTFTILTKLEDKEVGFSVEEGDFPNIPEAILGQPWPLGFGTVSKCKALQITQPLVGTLAEGFGVPDPVVLLQIRNLATLGAYAQLTNGSATDTNGDDLVDKFEFSFNCQDTADQIGNLQNTYWEQLQKVKSQVKIINGKKFPLNKRITISIGDGQFTGIMDSNEIFHFDFYGYEGIGAQAYVGPKITDGKTTTLTKTSTNQLVATCRINTGINGSVARNSDEFDHPKHPKLTPELAQQISDMTAHMEFVQQVEFEPLPIAQNFINMFAVDQSKLPEQLGFFEASSGSTVALVTDEPIDYIVNILPSTVLSVCSEIDNDGIKHLVGVPTTYYSIRTENFGSFTATVIRLNKPLTRYTNEKWTGNDLFLSYVSTVGSNVADIIQWIVQTYSNLSIDAASFAEAHADLACYGANFQLSERKNIVELIKEIAFQARSAILIKNATVFLKYLGKEPSAVDTITESDIENGSLEMLSTPTEELVTKLIATWNTNCYESTTKKMILRYNVKKYSIHEQTFNFYIYKTPECVKKSATFWLIRLANSWKRVKFNTFLHKLNVETMDCIVLDLPYFSNNPIKAIVETAQYDSSTNTISMECWLPVRTGEMEYYPFAWPATLSSTTKFPPEGDPNSGGSGVGSFASGTLLLGASDSLVLNDLGDTYPSDIDDICCQPSDTSCDPFTPYIPAVTAANNYLVKATFPETKVVLNPTTKPNSVSGIDDGSDGGSTSGGSPTSEYQQGKPCGGSVNGCCGVNQICFKYGCESCGWFCAYDPDAYNSLVGQGIIKPCK